MENIPSNEEKNPFEHQLSIAEELFRNVNDRNTMVSNNGGFDTFSVVMNGFPSLREDHEMYSREVTRLRKEFDEQVVDKQAFIQKLEELGKIELAQRIKSMFQL